MSKPDDVFYAIGYTNEQMVGISQITSMDVPLMKVSLNAAAKGFAVEEVIEIKTAMRLPDDPYGDFFEIVFMNDVALRMCRRMNVRLPRVLKKTTRSELPPS